MLDAMELVLLLISCIIVEKEVLIMAMREVLDIKGGRGRIV